MWNGIALEVEIHLPDRTEIEFCEVGIGNMGINGVLDVFFFT